ALFIGDHDAPIFEADGPAESRRDRLVSDAHQWLVDVDLITRRHQDLGSLRNTLFVVVGLGRGDLDSPRLFRAIDGDGAVDLADHGLAFGNSRLEQLLDAGQTSRDVETGDTTGVEGPHRQLGAWLANALSRDDSDCLAHIDDVSAGRATPVAILADSVGGLAG